MGFDQLLAGVHLPFDPDLRVPELNEVTIDTPDVDAIGDVRTTTSTAVVQRLAAAVEPGLRVAVGAGSRGLTDRVAILGGTIAGLRTLGCDPFVVPAMGSHAGGTADGQRRLLAELGITEAAVGAEIRSTMDTVEVARTRDGMPLHLDRFAAEADRILPVNRVKPHTSFTGPIESGCTKMSVVGFGKQPGAAQIHSCGAGEMGDRLLSGINALRRTGRLLGGVASIEAPSGDVVDVRVLTAADVGGTLEVQLTERARSLTPRLPFDDIDVLVVERGGKDISGTTIDPNVTGRFWVDGLDDFDQPHVRTIVLLDLTEVSGGNALGIGFADFVPSALAARVDWPATYLNAFTSGPPGPRRARLPMVLPDADACIKAALTMCGRPADAPKRVVKISSTLHLTRAWVSDAVAADLPPGVRLVV